MRSLQTRFISFLLVLLLVLSSVSVAYAAETDNEPSTEPSEISEVTEVTEPPTEEIHENSEIMTASEDYGIMPISGYQLSGVKLLNLASPYNYTCTLSSQVYVKYVPAGSSSPKTAGIQNMGWHYYSYGGVADKDKTIYCIEPYKDYNQGSSGNYMDEGVDVWGDNTTGSIGSNAWYALSSSQRRAIAYTLLYSEQRWDDSYSVLNYSKNNNPNYSLRVATQVLIYEIVTGLRDASSFERLDSNGYSSGRVLYDAFKDACPDFRTYYNGIVSDVQNAELLPSFCSSSSSSAPTITVEGSLTWVTDTNGVCGQFTFEEPNDDIWFNVYDTEVGMQNPYGFEGTALYSCYKTRPSTGSSSFSVFYGTSTSYQTCVTLHSAATSRTTGYFKVYVPSSTGNLNITKTTSDGKNLSGWQFSLYSNSACTSLISGPYTTNSSGKISITGLNAGTVYVKEVGHQTSSIANQYTCSSTNPRAVTISSGSTSSVSFTNTLNPGSLSIKKTTSDGKNLSGWQFSLYSNSACTSLISGPHTTDGNGSITVSNLSAGQTVYVKEVGHQTSSINSQYTCSSTNPQAVTITAGGTSTVNFQNTLRSGSLSLNKTTDDGENLSGWKFNIYSDAACTSLISGPHTTDANGKISVSLSAGTIYVKEIGHADSSIASQYTCSSANPQMVTITAGQTSTVSFANKRNLGNIKLVKQTNTGDNLSGWPIGLYTDAACTAKVDGSPFSTGEDGTITVSNLIPGTYYAKEELSSDPMWECDTEVKTVTVTANQTTSVTFHNIHYGKLKIGKTTKPSGNAEGWQFKVTNTDGAEIHGSPFTMTASGEIVIDKLLPGEYTVEELISDKGFYFCESENPQTVTVTAGQTAQTSFTNCLKSVSISIHKVNSRNTPLAGATFLLEWSEDNATWTPVHYAEKGHEKGGSTTAALKDGCLTTGPDGDILWDGLYPGLYYRITEVAAPEGYELLKDYAFKGQIPIEDMTVELRVVNGQGFVMPETGSNTGLLLHIAQLLSMGICAALLYVSCRKKEW